MEAREQWKQSGWIKDVHQEAEAARARAAEWSRKHCHLEEEGAEAGTSVEHCKRCSTKGKSVCGTSSPCCCFGVGLVCVHKLNAECHECHAWRTKCEYPGNTHVAPGSPPNDPPSFFVPP